MTIGAVAPKVRTTPDTYTALGDLVGLYAKPDNRELLIKTYGDQGITGFLQLTGAVNAAATQDEVVYWEEGRRHTLATVALANVDVDHIDLTVGSAQPVRDNDVLMGKASGKRYFVKKTGGAEGGTDFAADLFTLDGSTPTSMTLP